MMRVAFLVETADSFDRLKLLGFYLCRSITCAQHHTTACTAPATCPSCKLQVFGTQIVYILPITNHYRQTHQHRLSYHSLPFSLRNPPVLFRVVYRLRTPQSLNATQML